MRNRPHLSRDVPEPAEVRHRAVEAREDDARLCVNHHELRFGGRHGTRTDEVHEDHFGVRANVFICGVRQRERAAIALEHIRVAWRGNLWDERRHVEWAPAIRHAGNRERIGVTEGGFVELGLAWRQSRQQFLICRRIRAIHQRIHQVILCRRSAHGESRPICLVNRNRIRTRLQPRGLWHHEIHILHSLTADHKEALCIRVHAREVECHVTRVPKTVKKHHRIPRQIEVRRTVQLDEFVGVCARLVGVELIDCESLGKRLGGHKKRGDQEGGEAHHHE